MQKTFIINNEQLKVLSDHLLKSFYTDTEQFLRKKFPVSTKTITASEMRSIIEKGIEKAADYNIIERTDTRYFLEYMIKLGIDFDTNPSNQWVDDILNIRNLAGSEKIKRMLRAYSLTNER